MKMIIRLHFKCFFYIAKGFVTELVLSHVQSV